MKMNNTNTSIAITTTLPGFNFSCRRLGCTSHTTDTVNNIVDKNPE